MASNKIIAEKINIFLNLLFHLEDYMNNQQVREEQLHISNNVKIILKEVADSPKIKDYFFKGADSNHEIEEKEIEPEFRLMKLTDEKIRYIKKANPQSFNQKDLQLLNYFYNSSGEADMIYDSIKYKMLAIIKFCLSQIMLKKAKEKEQEIYSKINFVLISNNTNKLLKKLNYLKNNFFDKNNKMNLIKKNKSLADMREQFRIKPNFIIPPPINTKKKIIKENLYNSKLKKRADFNYNIDEYNKTSFSKNYKLVQPGSDDKNNENFPNINKISKTNYKSKIKITPSSQLDLIHILHRRKKKPEFNRSAKTNKLEMNKNNNNNYINIINNFENNKIIEQNKRSKSNIKRTNKKIDDNKINTNDFDYNKIFNMYDTLKKRGYIYSGN